MREFNPAIENLMKLSPSDSFRTPPSSSYKANNSWFEVNKTDSEPKKALKAKGAKS